MTDELEKMKDKVVWSCCFLVFGAGIVWGKLSGGSDFFKVKDIHDLFEIMGATATVIAASVAVSALSGWKGQFSHTEKYRVIRDFHGACQGCWNGYWYVSRGFDLIQDSWKNKDVEGWFDSEIKACSNALNESRELLEASFLLLKHHLGAGELQELSSKYWEYMNQVSSGGSEVIAYISRCRALIKEPVDEYFNYFVKSRERLDLIDQARKELCDAADILLARNARPE